MAFRITCIKKADGNHDNPYVAIESMSWTNDGNRETGHATRLSMYEFVKDGGKAYVQDAAGNKAFLEAKESPNGTKYVRTIPDQVQSDNLLKLKECY